MNWLLIGYYLGYITSFVNPHEVYELIHNITRHKRQEVEPIFKGHPKTREELWDRAFNGEKTEFDQTPSLVLLLDTLARRHLRDCVPVILYDAMVEHGEGLLLQQLFRKFPLTFLHGRIDEDYQIGDRRLLEPSGSDAKCRSYIMFLADVMRSSSVIGPQTRAKVIVVARSSQWRVQEFLANSESRFFVNLLVIGQSLREGDNTVEAPFVLYTHRLYADGLGSSAPRVLTSWMGGRLTRPRVQLFPMKLTEGFAGHRFIASAANQPPYMFKKQKLDSNGQVSISWEGIEYRLLNMFGNLLNYSVEYREPGDMTMGPGDSVRNELVGGRADIGVAGMYVTSERLTSLEMSSMHDQDCAVFITLSSTALPRYRAIMGPFHWSVWLALTFTYLIGIFPLAYSDRHTLKHLIDDTGEIENMFWYVFGTFTNAFSFTGENSWSKAEKFTTKLLIGSYWLFTIIVTACYTGSIIAFVTLPVFPETVNTIAELASGFFRVGTLDHGGWQHWFANSSEKAVAKLLKRVELVPDYHAGLYNTTHAFFWPYAFLGSRAQLEYIVQANFSVENKRTALHISDQCFVPFGVAISFPKHAVHAPRIDSLLQRALESGLITKITNQVKWDMQRSSTGKLLMVSSGKALRTAAPDERGLTLADTEGMFLLLGAGFLMAGASLLSEWMGGCSRKCRAKLAIARKKKQDEADDLRNEQIAAGIISSDDPKDDGTSPKNRKHRRRSSQTFRIDTPYPYPGSRLHAAYSDESVDQSWCSAPVEIHEENGTRQVHDLDETQNEDEQAEPGTEDQEVDNNNDHDIDNSNENFNENINEDGEPVNRPESNNINSVAQQFEGPMTYDEHKIHMQEMQNEPVEDYRCMNHESQENLLERRLFGERIH